MIPKKLPRIVKSSTKPKKSKPTTENPRHIKPNEIQKLRKFILKKQNGRCPICKRIIDDPCLDHYHIKKVRGDGLVRGVLCRTCNVFIAKSENNCVRCGLSQADLPSILRHMAEYLEKPRYPYLHPSERPKRLCLLKRSYDKLKRRYEGRAKFPEYPKSGTLTKKLELLFKEYGIVPEYYKQKKR